MTVRIVVFILFQLTQAGFGNWAGCPDALTGFSKMRSGEAVSSKWKASGWKDDRFPHVDFPRVTDSRFFGYGAYGRYYQARTSFRRGFWIKEFLKDFKDVLGETGYPLDVPTLEQLVQSARAAAESEDNVLKFLRTEVSMPHGLRAITTRGLATPVTIRYAEPLRGRVLVAILNDDSIDLEMRELLWKQFQGALSQLKKNLVSGRHLLSRDVEEIDGFGMKFDTIMHPFSVTICGTLYDSETDEFVIVDPFYFD